MQERKLHLLFALSLIAVCCCLQPTLADEPLFDDGLSENEAAMLKSQADAASEALKSLEMMDILLQYQQMQNGDCTPALEIEEKAKQGDARSQWVLADLYRNGLCVAADAATTKQWLQVAAAQGYAKAKYELALALMTEEANGANPDYIVKLFSEAFEDGVSDAGRRLAQMYSEGDRIPQDRTSAIKWYRRAIEADNLDAAAELGLLYLQGDGGKPDAATALEYLLPAAKRGQQFAQLLSSYALELIPTADNVIEAHKWANLASTSSQAEISELGTKQRNKLQSEMGPNQIAEAQHRASIFQPEEAKPAAVQTAIILPPIPPAEANGLSQTDAKARLKRYAIPITKDAFYEAIKTDNLGAFKLFQQAGASLETKFGMEQLTPLYLAVDWNSANIFAYLMSSGVNIEATNRNTGGTPLLRAIAHERSRMIDALLAKGASAKQDASFLDSGRDLMAGETPLSYAIMINNSMLVSRLFRHGASVDERYVYQQTPLMRAAKGKSPEIFKVLLEHGADPNAVDNLGNSVLSEVLSEPPFDAEVLGLALAAGANPNPPDHPPFLKAVYAGDAKATDLMADAGADVNVQWSIPLEQIPIMYSSFVRDIVTNGGTPLMLAAELGHASVAKVLIEHGADVQARVNIKGQQFSALDFARARGGKLVISVIETSQ